jgi:exonuclease III
MRKKNAIRTVNQQLDDLTSLLKLARSQYIVLAGDLNISTQFKGLDGVRHRAAFERLTHFGFVDALALGRPARAPLTHCHCRETRCLHVQTQWHNRSLKPWQTDYVFVSAPLACAVTACSVVPWERGRCSDHAPLVLVLDLHVNPGACSDVAPARA